MANEVKTRALLLTYTLEKDFVDPESGQTIPAGTVFVFLPETHAKAVLIDNENTLADLWSSLSKTDHTHNAATQASAGFLSAEDKAKLDSQGAGTCTTAAATAAKVLTVSGFTLKEGSLLIVKFSYTNTATAPTLNVNNTGAKSIYFQCAAIDAGFLVANTPYLFRYNGTQYEVVASDVTYYQTRLAEFSTTLTAIIGRVSALETELADLRGWCESEGYQGA